MTANLPAGALNNKSAPYNQLDYCEFMRDYRTSEGADIDDICGRDDVMPCPGCGRMFCPDHSAYDKRLMGCEECARDGLLFWCTRCGETVPEGRVAWPRGQCTCVCEGCAAALEVREARP